MSPRSLSESHLLWGPYSLVPVSPAPLQLSALISTHSSEEWSQPSLTSLWPFALYEIPRNPRGGKTEAEREVVSQGYPRGLRQSQHLSPGFQALGCTHGTSHSQRVLPTGGVEAQGGREPASNNCFFRWRGGPGPSRQV